MIVVEIVTVFVTMIVMEVVRVRVRVDVVITLISETKGNSKIQQSGRETVHTGWPQTPQDADIYRNLLAQSPNMVGKVRQIYERARGASTQVKT